VIFFVWLFLFGRIGAYGLDQRLLPEFYIVTALISGQAFWRHRANIGRLVRGRENKISFKSGKK
ncbi:MAG TPA: acyl-phosphate glycerol 3-phosphate acyltransferase, partial [Clostridium sp.]|nr:acyl-phosphate glycerol 3-phosphate acyltransferase [Clostridium sp.]